jgi:2-keto-4-pentenoate hydratase/2-oxohepta-3-ene-1,7-dioic acid hydratase in catechol pathway
MKIHAVHTPEGVRTAVLEGDTLVPPPAALALPGAFAPAAERDLGPLAQARLAAPLRPGKVVAIGLNYRDHAAEARLELPAEPLVMSKLPSAVIGPGEAIRFDPGLTARVDWEVELAFVIGRRARRVAEADALGHVLGYTVSNDVSARDLQWRDPQWVRAKSLDTFCPLGPCVTTADEVADPHALELFCRVNGETVQRSRTDQLIFGVAELIAFLSRNFTLEPGDVVMTGTPWGVGDFMDPPRHLHDGDVVESEVAGLGVLRNPVVEEPQGA